jgi:hypothetical protein
MVWNVLLHHRLDVAGRRATGGDDDVGDSFRPFRAETSEKTIKNMCTQRPSPLTPNIDLIHLVDGMGHACTKFGGLDRCSWWDRIFAILISTWNDQFSWECAVCWWIVGDTRPRNRLNIHYMICLNVNQASLIPRSCLVDREACVCCVVVDVVTEFFAFYDLRVTAVTEYESDNKCTNWRCLNMLKVIVVDVECTVGVLTNM